MTDIVVWGQLAAWVAARGGQPAHAGTFLQDEENPSSTRL